MDDIALRERNLFLDKSKYVSLLKEQEGLKKRLITVEANQSATSAKLDAIANSVELLTSVLILNDAKKGGEGCTCQIQTSSNSGEKG